MVVPPLAFASRKDVVVFIVDSDFESYDGHGRIVEEAVKRSFAGRIIPLDAGASSTGDYLSPERIAVSVLVIRQYAIAHPQSRLVVNMSYGTERYDPNSEKLFADMRRQGIVLVAAAGNDSANRCRYPAGYASVIAVGSVVRRMEWNHRYATAPYSNHGPCVELWATDDAMSDVVDVLARGYSAKSNYEKNPDDVLAYIAAVDALQQSKRKIAEKAHEIGTSFAAPQVTGLLAHLLELDPEMSLEQALTIMETTGTPLESADANGYVLNPFEAIKDMEEKRILPPLRRLTVAELIRRCQKGPYEKRYSAASVLGERKSEEAVRALGTLLLQEGSADIAPKVTEELADFYRSGFRSALNMLVIGLKTHNARGRDAVEESLASLNESAVPPLITALSTESAREGAANSLSRIGLRAVIPLLTAMQGGSNNVRTAAHRALSGIASRSSYGLDFNLSNADEYVLGTDENVRSLAAFLSVKDASTQSWAAWYLGRAGNSKATQPLVGCLSHENHELVGFCVDSLREVGDETAVPALEDLAPRSDGELQKRMLDAAAEIKARSAIVSNRHIKAAGGVRGWWTGLDDMSKGMAIAFSIIGLVVAVVCVFTLVTGARDEQNVRF